MPTRCPECGDLLEELDSFGEMGSRPKRYLCHACQLGFERDAGGTLVELPMSRDE
jgi:rubredoxin